MSDDIFSMMTKAGFREAIRQAKEEAWDEGEAAGQDNADSNRGYNVEHKYNPYRSAK